MLIIALLTVAAVFVLLFGLRIGGARRRLIAARWPGLVLGALSVVALLRGQLWIALAACGGIAVWLAVSRAREARPKAGAPEDRDDQEARRILGVSRDATVDQIRSAYRAKMAKAHPDRGGSHQDAARLTAARDRLLRR